MKVGVMLPYLDTASSGAEFRRWCEFADAGPFSTIGCGERIVFDNLEQMTLLMLAASVTSRIELMSTVSVLPMHPTALFAKQAATIDHLSDGRLTVGLGAGERPEDYAASERTMSQRYQTLDAQVSELRRLWSGARFQEGSAAIGPSTARPGGPRLLSGAYGPKALARAAKWTDGFIGGSAWENGRVVMMGAGRHATTVANWRNAWDAAGRPGKPYIVGQAWFTLADDGARHMYDFGSRYFSAADDSPHVFSPEMAPYVDEDKLRAGLDDFENAGFDEIVLLAPTVELSELERLALIIESR